MAAPPLPDVPCVRVRCLWTDGVGSQEAGLRFYLSYSGSAPSAANCASLASSIGTAWGTNVKSLMTSVNVLTEVDVLDIASTSGNSGTAAPSIAGTRAGNSLPLQVATNVEFTIGRRYRGGKPRMYLPAGADTDLQTIASWKTAYVTAVNTGVAAFFSAIHGLSIGSMGTLQHVNLSFYQGYRTRITGGGQTTFAPKYRSTAVHDDVTGYSCKSELGSQRRRRTSLT